jgi:hypothetical protein
MAARQDLHDLVCILSSDGHVSGPHRAVILEQARNMLPPEEYRSFKRALDRIPPPGRHVPYGNVGVAPMRPILTVQHAGQPVSAQRRLPADPRAYANSSPRPKKSPSKHPAQQKRSPAMLAANHRSSGVRNIPPPPKRSAEPAPLPASAGKPNPAAEPEGPNLVVPVAAILPDQVVPGSIAR